MALAYAQALRPKDQTAASLVDPHHQCLSCNLSSAVTANPVHHTVEELETVPVHTGCAPEH